MAHFRREAPETGLSASIFFVCLWQTKKDFRCNPGCMGEQQRSSVATSPLRGPRAFRASRG
jgi:hypothetical protein